MDLAPRRGGLVIGPGKAGTSSPKNWAIIRTAVNVLGLSRTPGTRVARIPLRISVANV
jgi:hypothetical protein